MSVNTHLWPSHYVRRKGITIGLTHCVFSLAVKNNIYKDSHVLIIALLLFVVIEGYLKNLLYNTIYYTNADSRVTEQV